MTTPSEKRRAHRDAMNAAATARANTDRVKNNRTAHNLAVATAVQKHKNCKTNPGNKGKIPQYEAPILPPEPEPVAEETAKEEKETKTGPSGKGNGKGNGKGKGRGKGNKNK